MSKSIPRRLARFLIPPALMLRLKALILRIRSSADDLENAVRLACAHSDFCAVQKESEILRLLKLLESEKLRLFCEIGGFSGGTLFLFCAALPQQARILSIDNRYTPKQLAAYPLFSRKKQEVTCMQADSHAAGTLENIKKWLGTDSLDFLFIDGDHSYAGVSEDFRMYAPLVKKGGYIAFHDIVPDFKTRYGKETGNWTGGVPVFWSEIKQRYAGQTTEYIEDAGQDGYGIGLLRWTRA